MHEDIIRTDFFILNGWSFMHFLWGLGLPFLIRFASRFFDGLIGLDTNIGFALFIFVIFEGLELFLWRQRVILGDRKGNFFVDSFWDIVFNMLGFIISIRYLV